MNITWQQLALIWTIIAISVGGTFTVAVYASEKEIAAYELRIQELERRVREVEKRLEVCLKAQDRQVVTARKAGTDSAVASPSVLITYPKAGAKVQLRDRVEFLVQGKLPTGFVALLAVRDPTGQWWSWGQSSTGAFTGVQFGEPRDDGELFEARVLLTDAPYEKNNPRATLPDAIASDSVIVVRE